MGASGVHAPAEADGPDVGEASPDAEGPPLGLDEPAVAVGVAPADAGANVEVAVVLQAAATSLRS